MIVGISSPFISVQESGYSCTEGVKEDLLLRLVVDVVELREV